MGDLSTGREVFIKQIMLNNFKEVCSYVFKVKACFQNQKILVSYSSKKKA